MLIKIDLPNAMLFFSTPKRWKYNLYQCKAEVCERPFESSDYDELLIAILSLSIFVKVEYFFISEINTR